DRIQKNVIDNTTYFLNELKETGFDPILKSCGVENLAGIVTVEHPKYRKIFDKLSEKDIICSVREGLLRFSPHFYNTREEIDRVIGELKNPV
ncbi:MAG: hypothetical protein ACM34N_07995, partial [Ignavibacteria bacterium]